MIETLLNEKLQTYRPVDAVEQELVLTEMMQHFVLVALAQAGFFSVAEFHGGTYLRLIHGLDRFSEDLDFVLQAPDSKFSWSGYLSKTCQYLEHEGLRFEVIEPANAPTPVKKAFFKTDAVGQILVLVHPRDRRRKIKIKVEVDTRPPAGSVCNTRYLDFPVLTAITVQNLESAFATKLHALLCRTYVKGRDWYDFLWYVHRRTVPHLVLLKNALFQAGPWAGQDLDVTPAWLTDELTRVVHALDWPKTAQDVARFLSPPARAGLTLWSTALFEEKIRALRSFL